MTGRPPLKKSERRSVIVLVRLRVAEHRELCAAAKRDGLSVSDYLRKRALERKPGK